ncbi:protein of unknown function [Cupriavidus neocaledonicus]|uniref:Uncharacterized protein n=1 Tax=Cupriavidus neocaledonicus TaxID=1040979 RepID=A0A375H625_9BURK|nr:hypothetical protein CBM2605_A60266 [Cupriavidus neocaledonicus]SPD45600.1 protein of unknown function [Cupriavidus neocaledonicus]
MGVFTPSLFSSSTVWRCDTPAPDVRTPRSRAIIIHGPRSNHETRADEEQRRPDSTEYVCVLGAVRLFNVGGADGIAALCSHSARIRKLILEILRLCG